MPRKPSKAKYAHSFFFGKVNCLLAATAIPKITIPIENLNHTTAIGEMSRKATLVALTRITYSARSDLGGFFYDLC